MYIHCVTHTKLEHPHDARSIVILYAGDKPELLATCCKLLMQLSRSDVCKQLIVGSSGLSIIVAALKSHPSCSNLQVCTRSCVSAYVCVSVYVWKCSRF